MKFFVFLRLLIVLKLSFFEYVVGQIPLPMPMPVPFPGAIPVQPPVYGQAANEDESWWDKSIPDDVELSDAPSGYSWLEPLDKSALDSMLDSDNSTEAAPPSTVASTEVPIRIVTDIPSTAMPSPSRISINIITPIASTPIPPSSKISVYTITPVEATTSP